jgi:two-component system, LytTR family, sensor kinase
MTFSLNVVYRLFIGWLKTIMNCIKIYTFVKKKMPDKRILKFFPLIFWSVIVAIKLLRIVPMYEGESLVYGLTTIAITTPLDIITFCFFYYLIIQSLFNGERIFLNAILSLMYIAGFGIIWSTVYKITGRITSFEGSLIIYKSSLGHTFLSLLYAVVLRLSVDWFNRYNIQKELEKINSITELALLRSQINPHFLFNTLNNINSFSTHDPVKTSFAIIKLSDIMRYMLYEAVNEKVELIKEVEHIANIIELQKLRFKEKDFVSFSIDGSINNIQIAPMLFLPFIENAFKHGSTNQAKAIKINLEVSPNKIHFTCENKIKELNETEINQPGGIGIKNIKRRLHLLYPELHELHIFEENNNYLVDLKIQLSED